MKIHEDACVQFVFDNTNYNVETLDGRETFHCLSGIAVYTPEYSVTYEDEIMTLKKLLKAAELAQKKQITDITLGKISRTALSNYMFEYLNKLFLTKMPLFPPTYDAYLLGKILKLPEFQHARIF